jgi:hypothetical protein
MKQKEKNTSKIGPQQLGLVAIARLFGINGNPVNNHAIHLALGQAIWGETWGESVASRQVELRTLIVSQYTPQTWRAIRTRQKEAIEFGSQQLGLVAIARLFGIDGNPRPQSRGSPRSRSGDLRGGLGRAGGLKTPGLAIVKVPPELTLGSGRMGMRSEPHCATMML